MQVILVVDDKKDVRHLLETFLKKLGYHPISCENGEHALEHIYQADMIITDFNMPGSMSGVDLIVQANRQKPGIPAIMMTGNLSEVPKFHLARRVIEKPFDLEQLKNVITELLQ